MMDRRSFLGVAMGGIAAFRGSRALLVGLAPSKRRYDTDYFHKITLFDKNHPSDVFLGPQDFEVLTHTVSRLRRLQSQVGHGNFQILGFDDALRLARSYASVGAFGRPELALIDRIFHEDAARYGFYGEKVWSRLTDNVRARDVIKIAGSGNYLLRGLPLARYREIRHVIGEDLILTSGVRSIVKQTYLFLNKVMKATGNVSRASRSLAPPGYSYHAVGDFDVGQRGLGRWNFTSSFAATEVYKRLASLGYVEIRYTRDNLFGVRFEPWHIKITARPASR